MADNYAKLPLQKSLNRLAIDRAQKAIEDTGNALPCRVTKVTGAIVTVEFEMQGTWTLPPVRIPKAESPWVRMPTQVGDKGVTMPADAYLGGVSGLGGGTADFRRRGNLSALVFVPVSNASSAPDDSNAAQVCGPNGMIARTTQGPTSSCVVNQSGVTLTFESGSLSVTGAGIVMSFGGHTITLDASGLSIDGNSYENHTHGYFPGTGSKTQTDPPIN
ncbi:MULTISPECIES: hypothetical protein [Burkholderia]|uniref:hypothetical protein n=1 Tax=Burkholderia TaxID=32008 RepID=UPI00075E101C|nr:MULTISPECIES: hypothetical protein [Burkholderia]AOJ69333.1 hypothetical protein WS78_11635 [Burkholderia savannae]KVG37451.1 hypothetical protein WS77_01865 [Burkholderia sp. MSMB0265]KVG88285.1 hypothetical protein WS81_25360 [Burkholderia sp. MSMB2040]KVG93836.1 hypothetical protein WS82_08855 [Burkholderia sp. MSMB2041]KVH01088.1 hypothetical protein WS83_20415 [Burkholderia sp. MSMB2042]